MGKLLVTGGTGLVGTAIDADVKLSTADGDLRNWQQTLELFEHHRPEKVIHCAGKVGGLVGNMNHKGEFFYDNVTINTNVLEAARRVGVKKLVSFLSTCIFPDNVEYPITEKQIHNGEPHHSNYPYAYAKRMLEVQSRAYNEQYGTNYVCVVPTNIYGPNDNFDTKNGHVIPSLIYKCYMAKKNNLDFYVWGTGAPLREFIYSEDVARLSEWAVDNYTDNEPIIFSPSNAISIKEVVNTIAKEFDFKGRIIWETDKPEGQYRKPTDNSKIRTCNPDFVFTEFGKGIRFTIEWFIENIEQGIRGVERDF